MSKLRSIDMSIKQAEQQFRQLLREMNQHRRQQKAAQLQLDQLLAYAQETQANFLRHTNRILNPSLLLHHHQFMVRLEDAVRRQTTVVDGTAQQISVCQAKLLSSEQRLTVLKSWRERRLHQQAMLEARELQKVNDDYAQRQTPLVLLLHQESS